MGHDVKKKKKIYIKSGIPITFREKGSHCGIEFITVTLHTPNDQILFANLYIHSGAFHVHRLPDCI